MTIERPVRSRCLTLSFATHEQFHDSRYSRKLSLLLLSVRFHPLLGSISSGAIPLFQDGKHSTYCVPCDHRQYLSYVTSRPLPLVPGLVPLSYHEAFNYQNLSLGKEEASGGPSDADMIRGPNMRWRPGSDQPASRKDLMTSSTENSPYLA
jgi:hypothetical protein